MNVPPKHAIRVSVKQLRGLTVELFTRAGLSPANAKIVTELLIDTDLRGVLSHGTNYANSYCQLLLERKLNARPRIRVLNETRCTLTVDGDGAMGHLPSQRMTELVIGKAKAQGIAAGVTRNHGHLRSAGKDVRQALQRDCVAWCVSGHFGIPYPKADLYSSMSDPPMCFGVPGGKGPPIIADMGARFFSDTSAQFRRRFADVPAAY